MFKFVARWIAAAVSLALTVKLGILLHLGMSLSDNTWGIMVAAGVFSLVSCTIGPVIKFLALPLSCLSLGLINLPINALLFWLTGWLSPDFEVHGFMAALIGSIIMSCVNGGLQSIVTNATSSKDINRYG